MSEWQTQLSAQLESLRSVDRWRECVAFDSPSTTQTSSAYGSVAGRNIISFASNDYLGLAHHPKVGAAARDAIDRFGTGSSASRLVTGTRGLHLDLEAALATFYEVERALLFPTGYSANLGVLTALGASDVTIFSDELNHASIIDGCRLAKASKIIYRHADMRHLEELLRANTAGRKLIVTESVFSMDGDAVPLQTIIALAREHRALVVIDEAHAVLGPKIIADAKVDLVRVGTLSKTFGALGGWVGGSRQVIEWLVNSARSFIFTTAPTPADTAAALMALKICGSQEGEQLRQKLRAFIDAIRPDHPSPILPLILGSENDALRAADALLEQGIYVPAIRPPTVAVGSSRLRFTLSAAHDDDMLLQLQQALRKSGLSL